MNVLAQFTRWLAIPLASVTRNEIGAYVDHLFQKRTESRKRSRAICKQSDSSSTISSMKKAWCWPTPSPKSRSACPKPLPRHLKDDQVANLFAVITKARDRAMFMLMLRCGLRVEEVAHLTVDAVEYRRTRALCRKRQGRQGPHGLCE